MEDVFAAKDDSPKCEDLFVVLNQVDTCCETILELRDRMD